MIGWEQETLQVDESVGRVQICSRVLQGTLSTLLALNVTTADGTATEGGQGIQQDYIPRPFQDFLYLDGHFTRDCTNVPIVDDITFDSALNETFFVSVLLEEVLDRVTISPSTVVVSITDNEGKQ